MLTAIKLLHTAVWALFAACILGIFAAAGTGRFGLALVFIGVVMLEVLVLLFNRMRCPLTGVAARYTSARADNFDIYLPLWLARYNQQIFGTLYVLGILYTLIAWLTQRPVV
jgi:cbb3-type cytochrome oxidase subunit 1